MADNPHGTYDLTITLTVTGNRGTAISKDVIEYLTRQDLGWGSKLDEAYYVEKVAVSKLEPIDPESIPF